MLFNSGQFFFFFIGVWLLYLMLEHRWQNWLLLLASYAFYGAWDYRFLSLIAISTIVDYNAGLGIAEAKKYGNQNKAKSWLLTSIMVNLGILCIFKYYNFFVSSFVEMVGWFDVKISIAYLDVILPVGISFYTFQTMSYSIDVYRGHQKPVYGLRDFALFVAFFPQLMAGPIERVGRMVPQLQKPRTIKETQLQEGGWLILWGLFKKVYIADNLAPYVAWAFEYRNLTTGIDAYIAIFAFAMQIYCDFSGYSDMALGLSNLFGIKLSLNFRLPYWSSNPIEFFQRWHITLGTWFRDYVYGPFRKLTSGKKSRYMILLPTMFLVGLWHGAAWHFVIWGLSWGLAMYGYRICKPWFVALHRKFPRLNTMFTTTGILVTFYIFCLTAVFFISPDVSYAAHALKLMLIDLSFSSYTKRDAISVLFYASPLIILQVAQYVSGNLLIIRHLPIAVRCLIYVLLVSLLISNGAVYLNEFIYFQF